MTKLEDDLRGARDGDPTNGGGLGMTLRDWFAGQALPSLLAELYRSSAARDVLYENVYAIASAGAYEAADAMLTARALAAATEAPNGR